MTLKSQGLLSGRRRAMVASVVSAQLVLALTLPMVAQAAMFTDVQGHWAQADIEKLAGQNVLGGYPDGTFRPQGPVNRAEFATILVKALGPNMMTTVPTMPVSPSFADVPTSHWAYRSVEMVKALGWVGGYPNGTYQPAQRISRAEAMVIMAKAANLPLPTPAQADAILSRYTDASLVPTWARPAVAASLNANISANYPNANQIRPQDLATRGEVAVMADSLSSYIASGSRPAQNQTAQTAPPAQPVQPVQSTPGVLTGRVSVVPAETRFTGTLVTPVSSEINRVGDRVELRVDQPLVASDNVVVVPWGSTIIGQVSEVKPAGRTGRNGELRIRFSEIQAPDGRRLPIQGSIATETGTLEGGTTKGRIFRALGTTAVGAGLGAALGTAMGPLSGGKVGRGAIYGTALGAGVGAVGSAIQKGQEVVVPSGDRLEIKLDQPITIEAAQ